MTSREATARPAAWAVEPDAGVPSSVDRSMGDIHAKGNPHVQLDPRNIALIAQALSARLAVVMQRISDNAVVTPLPAAHVMRIAREPARPSLCDRSWIVLLLPPLPAAGRGLG